MAHRWLHVQYRQGFVCIYAFPVMTSANEYYCTHCHRLGDLPYKRSHKNRSIRGNHNVKTVDCVELRILSHPAVNNPIRAQQYKWHIGSHVHVQSKNSKCPACYRISRPRVQAVVWRWLWIDGESCWHTRRSVSRSLLSTVIMAERQVRVVRRQAIC